MIFRKLLIISAILIFNSDTALGQYQSYSSAGNLSSQAIINTNDEGYLIASIEYCYTPGSIIIDGCVYAMQIVKTNSEGDTLWTNTLNYYSTRANFNLFENSNGGFTIFTMNDDTQTCNGILGSLFTQIEIFILDSFGQLISDVKFPDNCRLNLIDVIRKDDNSFIVLSLYETLSSAEAEGRLSIIDNLGNISNQLTFPLNRFRKGHLLQTGNNEFKIFYINSDYQLVFSTYDFDLNLIAEHVDPDENEFCFWAHFVYANTFENGDLGIVCHKLFQNNENTHFKRFNSDIEIISEKTSTLFRPTNLIELSDGNLAISTTSLTPDSNTQIVYLSALGDSLNSYVINQSQNQIPKSIIKNSSNNIAIIGSVNCCNLPDTLIGPSKTYLQLEQVAISSNEEIPNAKIKIYPNPISSNFHVEIENINEALELSFYSSSGELLFNKSPIDNNEYFSITKLPEGIYFYRIVGIESKQNLKSGKIIKHGN